MQQSVIIDTSALLATVRLRSAFRSPNRDKPHYALQDRQVRFSRYSCIGITRKIRARLVLGPRSYPMLECDVGPGVGMVEHSVRAGTSSLGYRVNGRSAQRLLPGTAIARVATDGATSRNWNAEPPGSRFRLGRV